MVVKMRIMMFKMRIMMIKMRIMMMNMRMKMPGILLLPHLCGPTKQPNKQASKVPPGANLFINNVTLSDNNILCLCM